MAKKQSLAAAAAALKAHNVLPPSDADLISGARRLCKHRAGRARKRLPVTLIRSCPDNCARLRLPRIRVCRSCCGAVNDLFLKRNRPPIA